VVSIAIRDSFFKELGGYRSKEIGLKKRIRATARTEFRA